MTTPITMRFDDSAIEQLKVAARKMSFEKNEDISYVDLVREAVKKTFSISDAPADEIAQKLDFDKRTNRTYWLEEDIVELNNSPLGIMLQKCIDTSDYSPYIELFQNELEKNLENSLPFKILRKSNGKNGMCEIARSLVAIAWVVAKRSSVPDQIMEEEKLLIPTAAIAAYPVVSLADIRPNMLVDILIQTTNAIIKTLLTHILSGLVDACEERGQIVDCTGINDFAFSEAFAQISQHDLIPKYIILSPKNYIKIPNQIINRPPLTEALSTKNYGTVSGCHVLVSSRMTPDEIYVVSDPASLGAIYVPKRPHIKYENLSQRLRIGFVSSCEYGFSIINDYAISCIRLNPVKPTAKSKKKKSLAPCLKQTVQ